MRPDRIALLLLVVTSTVLSACGNYDPETRLFRQIAPKPEQVQLDPPGAAIQGEAGDPNATEQALEICGERNLRCQAQNIADGLNGLTFNLLTVVDTVLQFPPTTREPGRRVWGPHFDRRGQNTFRFEMLRLGDGEAGSVEGEFVYCAHITPGDVTGADTSDISCADEEHASGLVRVISGTLIPGEELGEAARAGAGVLAFEGMNLARIDPNTELPATFAIAYDNTEDRTQISIQIEEVALDENQPFFGPAFYAYTRETDESGTFAFATRAQFVSSGPFEPIITSELEEFYISSQWQSDLAGRADAAICGGDIGESCEVDPVLATHCWDVDLQTTFFGDSLPMSEDDGDLNDCVFAAPLQTEE
jgi:hypothetical protein